MEQSITVVFDNDASGEWESGVAILKVVAPINMAGVVAMLKQVVIDDLAAASDDEIKLAPDEFEVYVIHTFEGECVEVVI